MTDETDSPFVPEPAPQLPALFHNPAKLPALLAAFALAQAEYLPVVRNRLVVQKLKNKQTGEYTGGTIKFMYAELETILDATRPFLAKHGLTFSQPLSTEPDGTWINSILAHKDGGMIISRMLLPKSNSMTEFGGVITYIRRYAAGPALGVSGEDDADNKDERDEDDGNGGEHGDTSSARPARAVPARKSAAAPDKTAPAKKAPAVGTINEGQVKFLNNKLTALKLSNDDAMAYLQRMDIQGHSTDITLEQFAKLTHELDRLRDA